MTQTTIHIQNVTTLEELKQEYKRPAMLHHPDMGGDTETMKAVSNGLPHARIEIQTAIKKQGRKTS